MACREGKKGSWEAETSVVVKETVDPLVMFQDISAEDSDSDDRPVEIE
jgi:hypothetical protein